MTHRHTIDFSSLSLKDKPEQSREFSFRDSDLRNSREKSGSFNTGKLRRSSFFGKGRMSSFFFGNDDNDSFYFDKSASEVEKNIKRAPWYRSLSKNDRNQLGLIMESGEEKVEETEINELIMVDMHPVLLQFSSFSTEMDYRNRTFYKFRGESRFQNMLTIAFDLAALVYDLVLMSKECKNESEIKLGLYAAIYFLFVFTPNVVVMLRPNILAFAGENLKGLMDGVFIGSSLSVSGILKVVLLSCLRNESDAYHYILVYLVYYIIAKSTAFKVLFQSYLFALAALIVSQLFLLALEDNIFTVCSAISLVMSFAVIILYTMGYYNKEKLSRTYYLVDNAKKMQLVKIKDHFKKIKTHMKKRSRKASEKFEVDFRSPIEKSLGILKTLRETDEGRRIQEELEFVISTLKKSSNTSWTPELLASTQQLTGSTTYKQAVEGWLQTYKKERNQNLMTRGKSATISSPRAPDIFRQSFTPSGIKVIPEVAEEEISSPKEKKEENNEDTSTSTKEEGEKKEEESSKSKEKPKSLDQVLAETPPPAQPPVDPLLTWMEDPARLVNFFGLPSPLNEEAIKRIDGGIKPYSTVGKLLTRDLGNWNLPIFKLKEFSKEKPLMYMIEHTFRELGLDMIFNIERHTLLKFADVMERGYKENPYHNSTHAADVLHNMYCLIKGPPLCDYLSDLEILACLYAAIIHDVGHPGVNNALMISTSTMHSYLFHDKSVLENFHLSAGFAATRGECGILDHLSSADFAKLRSLVIELVLATDMGNHFDLISRFNSTYDDNEEFEGPDEDRFALDPENKEDKELILKIAMKVCDIAHSTKDQELHKQWSAKMQKEFFEQGDKEIHLGLSVGPLMDRSQTKEQLAHSQSGFLEFVCQPLYEAWCKFAPEYDFIMQNLEANKKMWQDMEEEEKSK